MNKKAKTLLIVVFLVTLFIIEVHAQGQFVGSKNSNKYHYPSCYWAGRIKPENEIWFSSAQDAVNHGYIPCSVCQPPLPQSQDPIVPDEPEPSTPEEPEPLITPDPPTVDLLIRIVSEVIDGDTFDTIDGYQIRLADIDAPETDETGYLEAKEYLELLVESKTVTLDIDSYTGTDIYGRYVCLVYVEHNSTHCLNVNQALVEGGYATVSDFTNNEFSPNTWLLYSETETIPEFPNVTILLLILVIGMLFIIGYRRKIKLI